MQLGRVIYRLHYLGGGYGQIYVGAVMLAGYDAVDKGVYLLLVEILRPELRLAAQEHTVLDGIEDKSAAILVSYAGLVADEVYISLALALKLIVGQSVLIMPVTESSTS